MACESSSDAQEPSGNAILTCSPDNVEADALGGVYTLNVTCSSGEWNAYVDDGCKAWTSVKVAGSLEDKGTV
ncbi:MAG: beta-glucanase, partial [Bacteroides sp.]|nr:beta-glucanase [Bacteroides sp.]